MVTRVMLLFSLAWIIRLTKPLFTVSGTEISGRDLILILGGLFLLAKSTHEIHEKLEGEEGAASNRVAASFASVIIQIMLLDIVFSLDSVITAVGMVDELWVMVAAVIIAVGIMMWSAEPISAFVHRHPTVKMLALSFLLLIGLSLSPKASTTTFPRATSTSRWASRSSSSRSTCGCGENPARCTCTSRMWRRSRPSPSSHASARQSSETWRVRAAS